jgi:hypothetical protein
MDRLAARGPPPSRPGSGGIPARKAQRRSAARGRARRLRAQHSLRQHDSAGAAGAYELGSGYRAPHPVHHSLECGCDHSARQQAFFRAGRTHRELPVGGDALRHRLRPFLARAFRRARRRSRLHPGAFGPGYLRARLRRGAPDRGAAPELPPGSWRQGSRLISASLADAAVLAVPPPYPWDWAR